MSRKHFIALAAALRYTRPAFGSEHFAQWTRDCYEVARACAASNPNFDRVRFLTACGVEG